MPNAARLPILAAVLLPIAACNKPPADQARNQDMSVDGNFASGQLPDNAQIETLPPDESTETSSGELNAGDDNPDVNEVGNGH
jgi:hypothetical protein